MLRGVFSDLIYDTGAINSDRTAIYAGKDPAKIDYTALLKRYAHSEKMYEMLGYSFAEGSKLTAEEFRENIKGKYKSAVRVLHPDKNANKDATELFLRLNSAYTMLTELSSKAQYDRDMAYLYRSYTYSPASAAYYPTASTAYPPSQASSFAYPAASAAQPKQADSPDIIIEKLHRLSTEAEVENYVKQNIAVLQNNFVKFINHFKRDYWVKMWCFKHYLLAGGKIEFPNAGQNIEIAKMSVKDYVENLAEDNRKFHPPKPFCSNAELLDIIIAGFKNNYTFVTLQPLRILGLLQMLIEMAYESYPSQLQNFLMNYISHSNGGIAGEFQYRLIVQARKSLLMGDIKIYHFFITLLKQYASVDVLVDINEATQMLRISDLSYNKKLAIFKYMIKNCGEKTFEHFPFESTAFETVATLFDAGYVLSQHQLAALASAPKEYGVDNVLTRLNLKLGQKDNFSLLSFMSTESAILNTEPFKTLISQICSGALSGNQSTCSRDEFYSRVQALKNIIRNTQMVANIDLVLSKLKPPIVKAFSPAETVLNDYVANYLHDTQGCNDKVVELNRKICLGESVVIDSQASYNITTLVCAFAKKSISLIETLLPHFGSLSDEAFSAGILTENTAVITKLLNHQTVYPANLDATLSLCSVSTKRLVNELISDNKRHVSFFGLVIERAQANMTSNPEKQTSEHALPSAASISQSRGYASAVPTSDAAKAAVPTSEAAKAAAPAQSAFRQ